MCFKAENIDEKVWNDKAEELAYLAFEDQCTPCNPRIPMIQDMVQILKDAYNGYKVED